jgi:hypothetical protein
MNINEWLNAPFIDSEVMHTEAPESFVSDDSVDCLADTNPDYDPVVDPHRLVSEVAWAATEEGNYSAILNPENVYLSIVAEQCLEAFWCDEYADYYGVSSYEEYLAL